MHIDEPSSSSPADGDARFTPAPPPASRLAIVTSVPAPPDARTTNVLLETAEAPAPDALQATTVAAAVARELYESGREVRFAPAAPGQRVTVLLCDLDGAVLSRLTPARALEIATGEPVPGSRRG